MIAPGERRDVDEPLGALADRVVQAVGEHQAALGVGVVDLDGQPRGGGERRRRASSRAAEQVLGRADDADDPHRQPSAAIAPSASITAGAAGHVVLHVRHRPRPA